MSQIITIEDEFLQSLYYVDNNNGKYYYLWQFNNKTIKCLVHYESNILKLNVYTFLSNLFFWIKIKFIDGIAFISSQTCQLWKKILSVNDIFTELNSSKFYDVTCFHIKFLQSCNLVSNNFAYSYNIS